MKFSTTLSGRSTAAQLVMASHWRSSRDRTWLGSRTNKSLQICCGDDARIEIAIRQPIGTVGRIFTWCADTTQRPKRTPHIRIITRALRRRCVPDVVVERRVGAATDVPRIRHLRVVCEVLLFGTMTLSTPTRTTSTPLRHFHPDSDDDFHDIAIAMWR